MGGGVGWQWVGVWGAMGVGGAMGGGVGGQ